MDSANPDPALARAGTSTVAWSLVRSIAPAKRRVRLQIVLPVTCGSQWFERLARDFVPVVRDHNVRGLKKGSLQTAAAMLLKVEGGLPPGKIPAEN